MSEAVSPVSASTCHSVACLDTREGSILCRSAGEAVTLATRNPARVGRVASRQRGLNPGERADLVRFRLDETTGRITILETFLAGQKVFASPS